MTNYARVKKGGVEAYESVLAGRVGVSITKTTLVALKRGRVEKQQIFNDVLTALDELLLKMGILKK